MLAGSARLFGRRKEERPPKPANSKLGYSMVYPRAAILLSRGLVNSIRPESGIARMVLSRNKICHLAKVSKVVCHAGQERGESSADASKKLQHCSRNTHHSPNDMR